MKAFKEFNNINEDYNLTNEAAGSLKGVKEYRDGLTPELILELFPWLLKAKFKDAVIGIRDGYGRRRGEKFLRWYDGTWEKGVWKDGIWESGIWENGTWLDGHWVDGTWENGTWNKGTWWLGTWKNGTWKDGHWVDGTWENGTWIKGER
ncbi:MAG: hypothetical protein PHV15_10940 [Thomasclavelia ramosa]|nr:hypothetical protein [Thomasclavelia ramosa]